MAGDAEHGTFVLGNLAGGDEFPRAGHGDTPRRLGEDAGRLGEELDPLDDFLIGAVLRASPGLPHAPDRVVSVRGRSDRQRLGDRVGILDRLDDVGAVLECRADRRAPGSLRTVDREVALLHDAEIDELLVGLVDLGEQGARGHADHGVAGKLPAELFGDFKTHCLGSLRVVGAEVHVDEAPSVFTGDLGAEAVHLIVGPADADHIGSVDKRAEHLALLEIRWDQDVAFEPCIGGVGGDGVGQVASRGTGHHLESQFPGAAQSHGDHAVLEGKGRIVHRVVLDPEFPDPESLGQAVGLHKRSEAHLGAHGRLPIDRQQLPVTPHRLGARLDEFSGQDLANRIVVVGSLQRTEVEFADMDRLLLIETPALAALQIAEPGFFGHGISSLLRSRVTRKPRGPR